VSENGYLKLIQNLVDGELAMKSAIVDAQIAAGSLIRTSGDLVVANAAAGLTDSATSVRKAIAAFAHALISRGLIAESDVRSISDVAVTRSKVQTKRLEDECHKMIRGLAEELAPQGPTPQLMALLNCVGQAMGVCIDVVDLGAMAVDGAVN
jgi:hypothetical protein